MDVITPEELKKFDFNFLDEKRGEGAVSWLQRNFMVICKGVGEKIYRVCRVITAGKERKYVDGDVIEHSDLRNLEELIDALNNPSKLEKVIDNTYVQIKNSLFDLAKISKDRAEEANALFDETYRLIYQYDDPLTREILGYKLDNAMVAHENLYVPEKSLKINSLEYKGIKMELYELLQDDDIKLFPHEEREAVEKWFDKKRREINRFEDIGLKTAYSIELDNTMASYDRGELSN